MQELLALLIAQLRNVWRFRWTALIIAWVIASLAWLYVLSIPSQYESSARVHIDTASAISPLLSGMAVTPSSDQQIDLLIRTVMSRPNLARIARATGLDLRAATPEQEQALISGLANRIQLDNTGTDIYRITYTSSNPQTAQAVVQEVISVMTTINLSENTGKDNSSQAVTFLQNEVAKYKNQLNQTEQALANFKQKHAELMPGADDYVTRVQNLTANISTLQDQLATAQDQVSALRQQMSGGGAAHVTPAESVQVQQLDSQIESAKQNISQLLMKYTPKHPDVIAAEQQLAQLQKQREQTLDNLRAHPGQIQSPTSGNSAGESGNSSIASSIEQATVQVNTLQFELNRKQAQLKSLQAGANHMNDAQVQFAELSRNYQVTRDQYEKLLSRLYSARLSTDVQQTTGGLDFRVIDPPEVPARPTGPKRVLMMIIGLIGALAAGIAFALFLAQLRPVFTTRSGLTQATGYPVLGAVTRAQTGRERARRRKSLMIYAVFCATLILGFFVAVAIIPLATAYLPSLLPRPVL